MAGAPKLEEERPPHDAVEGVPLPRETTALVGHREAERALLDAYRSGRMPHGWVLVGDRGIGKATLAFRLARFVFSHPDPLVPEIAQAHDLSVPAGGHNVRLVAVGVHPNLLHLQREWNPKRAKFRTDIGVDTVRRINHFLGTTAGEGGWRVVIVDPADDMNPSAANAILKNLEEPPQRCVFLLITRSRGALLPTILSRCRTLDLDPLSKEEAQEVVRRVASDLAGASDEDGLAPALCGGSPRRLIELRKHDGLALYWLMLKALQSEDREAQLKLAALAADPGVGRQILDLYEGYLGRRVRGLPEPAAQSKAPAAPLVTWAELWEKAALTGRDVETYNLDRRQFVLDLLESSAAALH